MSTEPCPILIPSSNSRRRAATAMQPSTTSPIISRRPSQGTGQLGLSLPQTTYTASSVPVASENGTARSTSNKRPGDSVLKELRTETCGAPLRHPKPLTPSDLHTMVEQEQEAIVNRLSRELSLLRQQTSSVASTTSSTSVTMNDSIDGYHSPYLVNTAHPTASRRHRSSSSLSSSYVPVVQGSRTGNGSGIARSREASLSLVSPRPGDLSRPSRPPSITSRQSEGTLPSLATLIHKQQSHNCEHMPHNVSASLPGARRSSISHQKTPFLGNMSRQDLQMPQKGDFDAIKLENETLRRRVRDLELVVKKYRERDLAAVEKNTQDIVSELAMELGKAAVIPEDDAKEDPQAVNDNS